MQGCFRFNKVDFGLFYSGIIRDEKTIFTMVYDCGSKDNNALKKAIHDFQKTVKVGETLVSDGKWYGTKPVLDMLTISHLHDDHVNGLVDLFSSFTVKKVFLPYFPPAGIYEYLLFLALINGRDSYETYQLLLNLYLPDNKDNNMENRPEVHIISEEDGIGGPDLHPLWKFYFFNQVEDSQKITKLLSKIHNILALYKITSFADLYHFGAQVGKVVAGLRTAYQSVFGKYKMNATSLTLFHYPSDTKASTYVMREDATLLALSSATCTEQQSEGRTTLLTGDALYNAKTRARIYSVIGQFQNSVLQVPHHGSYRNWQSMQLQKSGIQFDYYVIPTAGKRYAHLPSTTRTTADIINQFHKTPNMITAQNDFTYVIG